MKVRVKDFMKKYASAKYKHGIYMPEDIFFKCSSLETSSTTIDLPDDIIEVIESNKRKDEEREALYREISNHRLAGFDKEDKKDVTGAISEYMKAIEIGETTTMFHAYAYAYERIIILLHKVKDYQSEAQYIAQYLGHKIRDKQRDKYQKRLGNLKAKFIESANNK